MARINIHQLAVRVTERESGRHPRDRQSIAQVKETIRLTLLELAEFPQDAIHNTIERYRRQAERTAEKKRGS